MTFFLFIRMIFNSAKLRISEQVLNKYILFKKNSFIFYCYIQTYELINYFLIFKVHLFTRVFLYV